MTLEEAKSIVIKKFPDRKLNGYWEKEDKYIFSFRGTGRRGCFFTVVAADGDVSYLHPMLAGVSFDDMIKI